MMGRETAWRLFSTELNSATCEIKGDGEKTASYVITPLGATVNRVLIMGVLTEKENVGSEDEPMWRGRIQDTASGNAYINIGRYQPEAAAAFADIEAPSLIAVVGKVRTFAAADERIFVSIRPERVKVVDEDVRNRWLFETAESTWRRLNDMKKALSINNVTEADLIKKGYDEKTAKGIVTALDQYGIPNSTTYLKTIQNALRKVLPDDNIDLGLPEDMCDMPEEITLDRPESQNNDDIEETILRIIDELDTGKGAFRDELEKRVEEEGISCMELEEISNSLMDKGMVYEPNLRYIKRV